MDVYSLEDDGNCNVGTGVYSMSSGTCTILNFCLRPGGRRADFIAVG